MTNPDPQVTDTQPVTDVQPETEYSPPAPAQSEATVSELENGAGFVVSYWRDGQRYAATGATEADARKLLDEQPDICLMRN